MISAVVLAKNEEKNLRRCLKSVTWADEILVVDDESTDNTVEIAKTFNAEIFSHSLNNDFSCQRNFGLVKARYDWVFFLDADEEVTPDLKREILSEINKTNQKVVGFYFKRMDFFLGKWLKHGETQFVKILRLAKKGEGQWKRRVDEIWVIKKETKVFKNPLLHYSHTNLKVFLERINRRSSLNAEVFYEEKKGLYFYEWLKPLGKFILNYFARLGFLDGVNGFVFAVLMSYHSFLVRSKLYVLERKK